jgi:hypothetical protein
MKHLLFIFVLVAFSAVADIAPVTVVPVKAENTDDYLLDVMSGESRIWQFEFSQTGAVKNLTGASGCIMTYQPTAGGTVYAVTGTVTSASNGVAQVKWESSNGTAAGRYRYAAAVVSSNSVLASARGVLTVSRGISGTAGDAPAWSVSADISTHNASASAHPDIRALIGSGGLQATNIGGGFYQFTGGN